MATTTQRVVTADKIVTIETVVTENDRVVDYDDIRAAVTIEPDDWCEAPWDNCDGYEHSTKKLGYYDHDGLKESAGYAQRSGRDGGSVLIELESTFADDYRFYRLNGLSKQVAFERVAQLKRDLLAQLVKWYENGWEVWHVSGEYEGYSGDGGCGGIYDDDGKYAEECADELADSIAAEMESDGYIVENRPVRKRWSNTDNRIHRQRWMSRINVTTGRGSAGRRQRRHNRQKWEETKRLMESLQST